VRIHIACGFLQPKSRREVDFEREVALLDEFIMSHNSVYDFCAMLEPNRAAGGDVLQTSRRPGTQDNPFIQLLQALLELRFLEGRWTQLESETHKLVILQTLRILTRDTMLQRRFLNRGGGEELVHIFDEQGARHLSEPLQQGPGAQNPLVHVASMLAKLDPNSPLLVQCRRTLCCLLSTSERFLLQSVLASLHKLSASPMILSPHCQGLMQMPTGDGMTAGEKLLDILSSDKMKPEYRQLAAEVVLNLCQTEDSRMLIVSLEGIKLLLGMVQNCSENLLVVTIRILERLVHYDSRQVFFCFFLLVFLPLPLPRSPLSPPSFSFSFDVSLSLSLSLFLSQKPTWSVSMWYPMYTYMYASKNVEREKEREKKRNREK